jgi:uncharacterized coiled-coil protein SlyX
MGELLESFEHSSSLLIPTEDGKMSDGKSRIVTRVLLSVVTLMFMLVAAMPLASAYSPSWATMAALDEGKSQAVTIIDNGNGTIFVIGGGMGNSGSNFVSASESVIAYYIKTGTSTMMAPMSTGVRGACGGLGQDGRIYVFSGYNTTNVATTQIYDIATDSWSSGASIPNNVFKGDCAVVWPDFYVFGGTGASTQVQIYGALNDTWYSGVPLLDARIAGAAVYSPSEDAIYYIGGKDGGDTTRDTVYRFYIASGTWSTKNPMPNPLLAFDAAIGADGIIYTLGGSNVDVPYSIPIYGYGNYYCANNDSWFPLSSMSFARKYLGVVTSSDGRLFAVGGNDDTTILGSVESLTVINAVSTLTPESIGQGGSAVLTLDLRSYASETGASLSFFMKSDSGTIYGIQNYAFPVAGKPIVIIDIPQAMPADNYTLNLTWTLNFATGSYVMPSDSIDFKVFGTTPLADQISNLNSNLTAQLTSQKNQIIALQDQNDELAEQLEQLKEDLNQTQSALDNATNELSDRTQQAADSASSAGTYALIALVLAIAMIMVFAFYMLTSGRFTSGRK